MRKFLYMACLVLFSRPAAATDGGVPSAGTVPRSLLLPLKYRPGPDPPPYTLKPAKDGSGDLIAEAPAFTARIAPDGTVHFEDHPRNLSLRPPWLPAPTPAGNPTLEGLIRHELKVGPVQLAPPTDSERPRPLDSIIPQTSPYRPGIECVYPMPCYLGLGPMPLNTTGKFDLTDELERQHGRDPQRHEKARFLAETRELRIQLAVRANKERLAEQRDRLPDILLTIACDNTRPVADRRNILEALLNEISSELAEGQNAIEQIRAFLSRFSERDAGFLCP